MHYQLLYSGQDGYLTASLVFDGNTIASTTGLKDKRAAQKWARREGRDHKIANTPEKTATHFVSISGSQNFSI